MEGSEGNGCKSVRFLQITGQIMTMLVPYENSDLIDLSTERFNNKELGGKSV